MIPREPCQSSPTSRRSARRSSTRWRATSACSSSARTSAPTAARSRSPTGCIDKFGEQRVIDTPISEAAIVGAAIGASYMGMRPVGEIQFIDFIACCFDMLTNFAATSRYRNGAGVPIVVRGPCGGGVGGGPFHSLNPEVVLPQHARAQDGRAVDRLRRQGAVEGGDPRRRPGALLRAQVPLSPHQGRRARRGLRRADRQGGDPARRARTSRSSRSARWCTPRWTRRSSSQPTASQAEVIDLRSLAPLDRDAILTSVAKTSRALLLHEATRTGGIGGELAAIIAEEAFEYLDAPIMRMASADTPVPYAPPLEAAFLPNVDKVVAGAQEIGGILRSAAWPPTSSCPRWASRSPRAPSSAGSRRSATPSTATSRSSRSRPTRWTPRSRRPAAGVLTEIKVKEGETVPVNRVVAVIGGSATAVPPPRRRRFGGTGAGRRRRRARPGFRRQSPGSRSSRDSR